MSSVLLELVEMARKNCEEVKQHKSSSGVVEQTVDVPVQQVIEEVPMVPKNRFESITDPGKTEAKPDFFIRILRDKVKSTITTGKEEASDIGMTHDEPTNFLDAVAKSGTKASMEVMAPGGNISMTGYIDVDFYFSPNDHETWPLELAKTNNERAVKDQKCNPLDEELHYHMEVLRILAESERQVLKKSGRVIFEYRLSAF